MAIDSLSKITLIEVLQNMAQDIQNVTAILLTNIRENSNVEYIEKFYRQELMSTKDKISRNKDRIFDYLASGRLELISYKEFYINTALQLECSISKLEAGIYRLLLSYSIEKGVDSDIYKAIEGLIGEIYNSSQSLVDLLRSISTGTKGNSEKRKMIEERFNKISDSEEKGDMIYREGLAKVLMKYSDKPSRLISFKETIEYLEDCLDCLFNSAVYIKLIGFSGLS
ncbi:hypothetical protein [Caldisphaera lagunensis]|nr:hypothetical protein [Caldisphaera lagunensis]